MKQAIPGVAPPELSEVTVMAIWPSIAVMPLGRLVGRMCMLDWGVGKFFTVGKLFALASIPLAMMMFFSRYIAAIMSYLTFGMLPDPCQRYRLTNRRVIIEKGLRGGVESSVDLDAFDAIDIEVQPGQEWFPAGNLVFRNGPVEVFRLGGVARPEGFRHACLKSRMSYVGVKRAREAQQAAAE